MAGEAAAAMLGVQAVQLLLTSLEANLAFGAFLCPIAPTIDTITSTPFDYIVVGGGSAGSVLANRLSACSDANVLLLETGGCPPLESDCMGYFTVQPRSLFDYNFTSTNDHYACQNLQGGVASATTGRMLGGTSGLHHGIWVRGSEKDYDAWASASGDSSWNYDGLLPYFKKSENVQDPQIVAADSAYAGTSGPTILQRQPSPENDGIFSGFQDLGYTVAINANANVTSRVIVEPLISIGDKLRQSSLVSYIAPVKDRSNLFILTGATVSKINFDSDNVATGVTFTYNDVSYTVTASSEVILSAGAIRTPQLLMLSGVGPSDHLMEKGIDVVSNLPVGDNLMDHVSSTMLIGLEADTSTTPAASPFDFPAPTTVSYINLSNPTSQVAEYQSINLVFPHDSAGLLQVCVNVLKYTETICQAMYEANVGRKILWTVPNLLRPASRGTVRLATTNIDDQPLVALGLLSDKSDVVSLAAFLEHTASIVNTTYFKSIGAEVIDLGLCSDEIKYSPEYWQCYALAMSSTMWRYSGTAAMGSVVDANLLVKGVSKLRVVDASVFPTVPGGNMNGAVLAVAEKISDVIVSGRSTCSTE